MLVIDTVSLSRLGRDVLRSLPGANSITSDLSDFSPVLKLH